MPGDEEPQPEHHRLRFHVLGPVRADRDGQPLPLGSPQERATLAILLLRDGRSLTASELVDALWGDDPPHRAMDTLRAYVTRLRTVLEPGRPFRGRAKVLVSTGGGYAVRVPPGSLDATVFEEHLAAAATARASGDAAGAYARLTAALALWEGPALAGLTGPYAERERARLTELRATAREDHYDCALALGRHAESVAGLRALAAEQPLRERPRALLMLALHRAGRQAEALAVFSEAERLLPDGPGPGLVRLRERILAGDPALAAPAVSGAGPASGAVAASGGGPASGAAVGPSDGWGSSGPGPARPVLDLLPPEPACFTGREPLTGEVRAALAEGNVVVLTGPGGTGKTALATHTARAVRADYPDGLLHVDLRGTGPEPVDTGAALAGLLHALGVTDAALPDDVERRAALYRSLLADRRVLVVLDDAHDTARVRPLLPGVPGCAALVTTRSPDLALPGARTVGVDAMEEKEALAMLTAVGGGRAAGSAVAGGDAARSVVAACGRLPLALRIAGARLTTPPASTPGDLAARLAEERQRLDTLHADVGVGGDAVVLEAACRVAHDALEPETARAFRLLALPDAGPLDAASAAAVLDLPDAARAEAVAGGPARAGLLEAAGPGRYGHHALVRLFARRQSERLDSPPVRDAALLRLLDHQLATAVTALLRLTPDSPLPRHLLHHLATAGRPLADAGAARAWAHDAHPDVLATVRQVLAQDVPDALRPAVDLLTVWAALTAGTARRHDLEPFVRQALDRARERGDDTAAARTLRLPVAPAPEELRSALRLAEEVHDPLTPLLAGFELGVALLELDRADEALPLLVRAEEGLAREGAAGCAAEALAHAARAYIALGRPEESLAAAEAAVERARAAGQGRTLALVLLQTGRAHLRADRTSAAADRLREALAVEPEGTDPRREALVWAWLARCRLAQLRHREAVAAADRALALEAGPGDDHVRGLALAARGRAQLALGEPRLALGALREAHEVLARRGAAEAAEVAALLNEEFGAV